jgi:photosystem II stability/assembly factor-like uncharacterized protein
VGSLSPAITGDPRAVTKVRFADVHDGWAFGPQLWSTHDGGHSWHRINLASGDAGTVADVEASGGEAYALVGGHLLRTSVTSDSWSAVPGVSLASSPRSLALHGHAVWVVVSPGPGASALVTSQDGAAWRTLPNPCASLGAEWALAGAAPVSSSDVYLLCGGGAAAGSQAKKVLFSSDGGAHATATIADPPFGGDAGEIAAASTAVIAVSAASGASWVYLSSDGGHTWRTALQEGDGGVGYFDLGFTTSTQGVAVYGQLGTSTHSSLLMTRDAGASWAPATF